MKGAGVIAFALLIDGLQAGIALSLTGVFTGLGLTIPFIGAAFFPVGIMVGMIVDVCLSVTFGAALLLLLAYNGMAYVRYFLPGGIVEVIPGFDLLPTWTAVAVLCVLRKNKENKNAPGLISKGLAAITGMSGASAPTLAQGAAVALRATGAQISTPPPSHDNTRPETAALQVNNSVDGIFKRPDMQSSAHNNSSQTLRNAA